MLRKRFADIELVCRPLRLSAAIIALWLPPATTAVADPLISPPTFSTDPASGTLDLLIVAKPKPISLPFGIATTGWVYEVCRRPAGVANSCPSGSVQPLGGVHLALSKGDTLKFRLVNKLPPVGDSKHCLEAGHADLGNNPTNLHTHGLLVEPHRAVGPRDTYGDYAFLEIRNTANHAACPTPSATIGAPASFLPQKICSSRKAGLGVPDAIHPDMDVADDAAEYSIAIPDNHPSGLYWFHPHLHGISMNQITAGLAGFLTVGSAADACKDAACRAQVRAGGEQLMMLQDMQVEANGVLDTQQNAAFCTGGSDDGGPSKTNSASRPSASQPPQGSCNRPEKPGRWFHTVNGQVYPTVAIGSHGSIWRLVNASPSRSYDLTLTRADGVRLAMQVLSVDGVPIESSDPADAQHAARVLGYRGETVPCTSTYAAGASGVCVRRFQMMPSSRVELRIVNPQRTAAQAVLQTALYATGPSGDVWPAIALAGVELAAAAPDAAATIAVGGARAVVANGGALARAATIAIPGTSRLVSPAQARALLGAGSVASLLQNHLRQAPLFAISPAQQTGAQTDAACRRLPPGHRRRIYFGYGPQAESFGLGYAEVDQAGAEVAGSQRPVAPYDPTTTSICLPLRSGNLPVTETWELVNLTGEDHNFHSHQARFRILSNDASAGPQDAVYVLHDNIPVPRGGATCDGTLARAQAGKCRTTTTVVSVTFAEIGDFVYHCHIMEHEDGGMMARIRVVPDG